MHQRRITIWTRIYQAWHGCWKHRYVIYGFIPPACVKNWRRGWTKGKGSGGIYSWKKNEKRHERGTRWLCRWIGPLSRHQFNRKFCTGFPVSISLPHSPPSLLRLLSPLQSPNLRFSRDFSASSKMKGSLWNLFQRSSPFLFVDENRPLSAHFRELWSRFSPPPFFFEHVLSTFGRKERCGKIVRGFRSCCGSAAGISIFNRTRLT